MRCLAPLLSCVQCNIVCNFILWRKWSKNTTVICFNTRGIETQQWFSIFNNITIVPVWLPLISNAVHQKDSGFLLIVFVITNHCNGIKWDHILLALVNRENIRAKTNQPNSHSKDVRGFLLFWGLWVGKGKEGSKGRNYATVMLGWYPWTFAKSAFLGMGLDDIT